MVWLNSIPPETNGIGEVATTAAAAIARSQTSTAYRRETFRASGPSRKPKDTVALKNMSRRRHVRGEVRRNGHERDEAKHRHRVTPS
jgi:hypothetical protein